MNVVYFTAGETVLDHDIRRQCLRIPEVLHALNSSSLKNEIDLMPSLLLDEEFSKLGQVLQMQVVQHVQNGLFERFLRARLAYQEIYRRRDKGGADFVLNALLGHAKEDFLVQVFVVGPGLDELSLRTKNHKNIKWIDVIAQDPLLEWFWAPLSKAANG